MDAVLIVMIVVVVLCVLGVIPMIHSSASEYRLDEMRAVASERGLSFTKKTDRGHERRFGHFEIFSRRCTGKGAHNRVEGDLGIGGHAMRVRMGDYQYKTKFLGINVPEKGPPPILSYLIVELPWKGDHGDGGGQIPDLLIRRELISDKVGDIFGWHDIDFECPAFSMRFFVRSTNREFVYGICHQQMRDWMLEEQGLFRRGLFEVNLEIRGGDLCLRREGGRWKGEEFEDVLAWVVRFLEHWPASVIKDLESGKYRDSP